MQSSKMMHITGYVNYMYYSRWSLHIKTFEGK